MGHDRLTPKQEAFALEYITNGKNATEAYLSCYDVKTDNKGTIWRNAYEVLNNSKVATRIHKLEMAEFGNHILTIEERKNILTQRSKDGDMKALDILNKMDGAYEEHNRQKQDVNKIDKIEVILDTKNDTTA